jgi:hypothetical protein
MYAWFALAAAMWYAEAETIAVIFVAVAVADGVLHND